MESQGGTISKIFCNLGVNLGNFINNPLFSNFILYPREGIVKRKKEIDKERGILSKRANLKEGVLMEVPRILSEKIEEETLSPYATLSKNTKGREKFIPPCSLRTEFQRDRDRIIHSKSFRRLKHKTQVFLAPEGTTTEQDLPIH